MAAYAGIGSRETPIEVIEAFERLGFWLASKGYILRSGHADGADSAFERGCVRANGTMEIYLPWKGFNESASEYILKQNDEAISIASRFHPAFDRLSQGAQKLQARNSYQVLGYDLNTPSKFVICWTKQGKGSGGTGQAIRLAKKYSIPVFDFGKFDIEEAKKEFNVFFTELT